MPWSSTALRNSVDDDGAGDAAVGGDRQGVAGVVVEPVEDLDVGAVGEPPVGEVGLPAFVGLFGGEADVGGLRAFLRLRGDQPGRAQVAVDRGARHDQAVVVLEVPGDGVRAVVEPFAGELLRAARRSGRCVAAAAGRGWCAAAVSAARTRPRPQPGSGPPACEIQPCETP